MTNFDAWSPYLADALVVFGCFILTAGVIGLIRMPDIYTKIHAASKAVFLGAIVLMGASIIATRESDIILRVALIAVALILTTPVASHVIAQSAAIEHEPMASPGAIDESDYHLAVADHVEQADVL